MSAVPDGQPPSEYTELSGERFIFTGEYFEEYLPTSRRVALRNKRRVLYPVYRGERSGVTVCRADLAVTPKR